MPSSRSTLPAKRRFCKECAILKKRNVSNGTIKNGCIYALLVERYFEGGLLETDVCYDFHEDPAKHHHEQVVHEYAYWSSGNVRITEWQKKKDTIFKKKYSRKDAPKIVYTYIDMFQIILVIVSHVSFSFYLKFSKKFTNF